MMKHQILSLSRLAHVFISIGALLLLLAGTFTLAQAAPPRQDAAGAFWGGVKLTLSHGFPPCSKAVPIPPARASAARLFSATQFIPTLLFSRSLPHSLFLQHPVLSERRGASFQLAFPAAATKHLSPRGRLLNQAKARRDKKIRSRVIDCRADWLMNWMS